MTELIYSILNVIYGCLVIGGTVFALIGGFLFVVGSIFDKQEGGLPPCLRPDTSVIMALIMALMASGNDSPEDGDDDNDDNNGEAV